MDQPDKIRENYLRRVALRRGMVLRKSRRRDENALDFGMFMVVDLERNYLVHASAPWGGFALTLEEAGEIIEGEQ